MPSLALDLTDKLSRFPVAYGYQPVRGWPIKSFEEITGQSIRRTKQQALAEGPWDGLDKLWMDAFPIPPEDYFFHNGLESDVPDTFFPNEVSHPWKAYVSAKGLAGLSQEQTDLLFGIYRTLRTANYNGAGVQIDVNGNPVGGGDPRNYFFFKPNPANVATDQIIRWGKRLPIHVNWPAWIDWRDFNDELINWDDAKYTPRSISLTPTGGGSLSLGTYYIRVSGMKGSDESSASRQNGEIAASQITLTGGSNAFQVNWLVPETTTDHTAFRVYVGTVSGTWLGYFVVSNPAQRTLLITTTAGTTAGNPLDQAVAGLLRQIKRFECMPFFIPPYDLSVALDRICQISCADWQWSGLGTNTYRNDKVRFMSPATRASVFTINLAETAPGSFHTYPVDRRSRPNQLVVNFRDRDDEFLAEGVPVILDRATLQEDDGIVKPFIIDIGTAYRSQAQRVAGYYARLLCDMDQMANLIGSPKTYHILPGDPVLLTNATPNWTDIKFMVQKKQENIEGKLGDPLMLRLYVDGMYSDTDHSALPRPLPIQPADPFAAPPLVDSVVLSEVSVQRPDGLYYIAVRGVVTFANFSALQRGRVYVNKPSDTPGDYEATGIIVIPDATNQGIFEYVASEVGVYNFKVVSEGPLGASLGLTASVAYPITIVGFPPTAAPASFLGFFDAINKDLLLQWVGSALVSASMEKHELEIRNVADTETVRGPVFIRPDLNRRLQEYVVWNTAFVAVNAPPPPAADRAVLLADGGVNFIHSSGVVIFSAATAEIVGGLLIEWEVPPSGYITPTWFAIYPDGGPDQPDILGAGFLWQTVEIVGPPYLGWKVVPGGYPGEGGPILSINAGDRLGVYIRPDGVAEYHLNYTPSNTPLLISGKPVNTSVMYRAWMRQNSGEVPPFGIPGVGVRKVSWLRQGPEWKYVAAGQQLDFALTPPAVPAVIKARVRQMSPYVNGSPSAWVNGTFTRP